MCLKKSSSQHYYLPSAAIFVFFMCIQCYRFYSTQKIGSFFKKTASNFGNLELDDFAPSLHCTFDQFRVVVLCIYPCDILKSRLLVKIVQIPANWNGPFVYFFPEWKFLLNKKTLPVILPVPNKLISSNRLLVPIQIDSRLEIWTQYIIFSSESLGYGSVVISLPHNNCDGNIGHG